MKFYLLFLKHQTDQSFLRTIATILAVILTTLIFLTAASLGRGIIERFQKNDLISGILSTATPIQETSRNDTMYLSVYDTKYGNESIKEVGVKKKIQSTVLPRGLTDLPAEGELWVTPGLGRLIDANADLAKRYSQYTVLPTFPSELAASPDSLMVLYQLPQKAIGVHNQDVLATTTGALREAYSRQDSTRTVLIMTLSLLAGVILIVPVLLLITQTARIGIVQREKKYAALSLVGATRSQVRLLLLMETLPIGLIGAVLGIAIFIFLGLPIVANMTIGDGRLWLGDLSLPFWVYAAVAISTVICVAIASVQSIRRINLSPLAVTRTHNEFRDPTPFSLSPLAFGLSGLYILSTFCRSWYKDNPEPGSIILAVLLLLVVLGIYLAGPYLTKWLSILVLSFSNSASVMLAANRLRSLSRKTFYSIGGVVLALFVGSLMMTLLATLQATDDKNRAPNYSDAVLKDLDPLRLPLQATIYPPSGDSSKLIEHFLDDPVLSNLVSAHYMQKTFIEKSDLNNELSNPLRGDYYESCLIFEQRTKRECPEGVEPTKPFIAMLQADQSLMQASRFKVQYINVNISTGTITDKGYVLIAKNPLFFAKMIDRYYDIASTYHLSTGTILTAEFGKLDTLDHSAIINGIGGIILLVISIVVITGGLSLLVSVTGGIFERKRTFIRLRLLGAGLSTLAKSLSFEILIPLSILSLLVVGLGVFSCYCVLATFSAFDDGTLLFRLPNADFWIGLATAVLLCVIFSLINLPVLSKIVTFEEMRSE